MFFAEVAFSLSVFIILKKLQNWNAKKSFDINIIAQIRCSKALKFLKRLESEGFMDKLKDWIYQNDWAY